ncbi:MAG: TonB-dependent receptor domain-containing protein, partial [Spirochaetaceae bacterium]
ARIYNGDVRWELYPAEKELLSVGAFYKYFDNPIESFAMNFGGGELINTLANIPAAQNTGAELEWNLKGRYIADIIREGVIRGIQLDSPERTARRRRALGGVAGFLRDLTLGGNFTYIWSQIDLGEEGEEFQFELTDPNTGEREAKTFANTETERRLQGQSPYVVNASLSYRNSVSWSQQKEQFTNVTLNYNVFGPRITDIGVNGVPDTYEQPFHQLDLVVSQSISEYVSFGFSAKNLLDLPARFTVGEEVQPETDDNPGNIVQEYRKGRSFSISAKIDL